MKKRTLIALTLISGIYMSCKQENKAETIGSDNPLLAIYETPYEVPPFHLIKNEHFKPAILEAIRIQQNEIEAIANDPAKPDFKNTIEAMENSGALLNRITTVFYNLNSANTNDTLQKLAQELAPELSKHNDNIHLNDKLFARVQQVWDTQITFKLNAEETKLLEKKYKTFVRSGAKLNAQQKDRLRKINEDLSVLSLKYGDNILAENNAYELVIDNEKNLAGLPAEIIDAAAAEAKNRNKEGKWIFTLHNGSVMPFLTYAKNRELRKEIWNAYQKRGNNGNKLDNRINVVEMANLALALTPDIDFEINPNEE